ncbi:MAG: MBL fold metallo-hydrolase [Syntrophobacteraceae bacterium]|jgi:glyoxylase-like metal-dependent hydrolase (beta-lactamase superfamily II)
MDRIQYLLSAHSHYDHCGAVPYLRRRYPHRQVLASREAEKIYGM